MRYVISYLPDDDPLGDEPSKIVARLAPYHVEMGPGDATMFTSAPEEIVRAAVEGYPNWLVSEEGRLQMLGSRAIKTVDLDDDMIDALEAAQHPIFTDIENLRTLFEVMADKIGPENARISLERLARVEAALRGNFDCT